MGKLKKISMYVILTPVMLVLLFVIIDLVDEFLMKETANKQIQKCFAELSSQLPSSEYKNYSDLFSSLSKKNSSGCYRLNNWHPGDRGKHTQEIDYGAHKNVYVASVKNFKMLPFYIDKYDSYNIVKDSNYIYVDGDYDVTVFNASHNVVDSYTTKRFSDNEDGTVTEIRTKLKWDSSTHFIDNNDGTITDIKTNLTWKRCSAGQIWAKETCIGKPKDFSWEDALNQAKDGWRLPTVEELESLVFCSSNQRRASIRTNGNYVAQTDGQCEGKYGMPTINQWAFPETRVGFYWSSSDYTGDMRGQLDQEDIESGEELVLWAVQFNTGRVHGALKSNDAGSVRLVRSSQ